jgi:hypothetical protein
MKIIMGIPPLAFSIWYQGQAAAPPDVRRVLRNNRRKAHASGWEFVVFDGKDLRRACVECGVGEVYDAYRHMHQRIDLGRLCLLYVHGGVSVDADQRFIKPCGALPHLRGTTPVLSEVGCRRGHALCHRAVSMGARHSVNNALIMSPTRSPTMLEIVRRVASRPHLRLGNPFLDVQVTTGPMSVSHAVSDMIADGRVKVMSATIVEPCSLNFGNTLRQAFTGHRARCAVFPDTVAVHPYTMSWFSPKDFVKMCCVLLIVVAVLVFRRTLFASAARLLRRRRA